MAWWVYKCNRSSEFNYRGAWEPHFTNSLASGELFDFGDCDIVGSDELVVGDRVLAYQTDENTLVGIASLIEWDRDGYMLFRADEALGVRMYPLKKGDSRVAILPQFRQGFIRTFYPMDDSDAKYLIALARKVRDGEVTYRVSSFPGVFRRSRGAKKRGGAKRVHR